MNWLLSIAIVLAAAAAAAIVRNHQLQQVLQDAPSDYVPDASPDGGVQQTDPIDQAPTIMESIAVTLNPSTYVPAGVDQATADRNVRAFLDTIGYSEGADYNSLVGGGTFGSYADHPRQRILVRPGLWSTAAGKYQILARTWDDVRARLQLPDFTPASQDAAAVELIRERGALNDVRAGRFAQAIDKCKGCWASLPGAGYGQPERNFTTLQAVYARAGGTFESQA